MSPRDKAVELINQSLGIMKADQLDASIIAASCGVSKAEVLQLIEDLAQPESANGQIRTPFEDRAQILTARGIPVAPVQPKDKVCKLLGWEKLATTNLETVKVWGQGSPDGNTAAVARAESDGFCFFEVDQPNFHEVIQKQTGQKFPETFVVSSSPGRGKGHFYFKQTPASIALQKNVISGKDENGKEAWSFRINNAYVVGPNSVKGTGEVYIIKNPDASIAEIPDWLVAWIAASKTEDKKTGHAELDDESIVTEGARNNTLTSVLGRARQVLRMDREELFEYGRSVNQKRLSPPLSETEVRTISDSIGGYAVKPGSQPGDVLVGGQAVGAPKTETTQATAIEIPKIETFEFPRFPTWLLSGCAMYDNYIKEVCEKNCRYDYMMFVPGMAILLNYLGTKIRMNRSGHINGAMVNIIGKKGRVIKSSSVQDMFAYYQLAGVLGHCGTNTGNAEGRSLVWSAGSTEGVGVEAERVNAKNMILFFDELKTLADKAGIEGSSMGGHLLTMLQSGKFANKVKSRKDSFHFDPDTYTASVLTCCTDRMFPRYWSKLIAFSDGLEDRATLVLQPKQLKPVTPRVYVLPSEEAVAQERRLIDKAVMQQSYEFDDTAALEAFAEKYGNRSEIRAEEWAVAFCVQMGRDTVDQECIDRGIALETYNIQVKRYLNVREAETREAVIQNHVVQLLMQNGGSITLRELGKRVRPDRYGTQLWGNCYRGLIQAGITMETGTGAHGDPRTGKPGDPKRLVLLQAPERDDD
jgi:Bifunctional DNA primase/polymerase, N-terminal/Primase C terminal 1 (PriCT-1)